MGRKVRPTANPSAKPRVEKPLPIIIDSREQQPYDYTGAAVMALRSGDYSLFGYEKQIAIERKSLKDVFGSVGGQRKRFEKEVQRLAVMDYAAIVVEATLEECLQPLPFSQMNPKAVVNTLLAWSVKYRLAVFFAGNRRLGKAVTYRLLEKFFNYQQEKRSGQQQ